ncbi:MAG: PRC-barrel domain-containing protein [Nanoarchaeota archaeon]|nr:PRC-barrel domain-containing protein [Nanoarchaeota archaeon]
MQRKNISGRKLNNAITSEDILGKDVIDLEGNLVGVVEKIFIDPASLRFIGISVDKGFIKKGLSIGKNYILKITEHAVFLKIRIAYDMKGMFVFDKDGKKIGKVSSIELHGNRNKIKSIHVETGLFSSLLKKGLIIPARSIKRIGDNIILKNSEKILLRNGLYNAILQSTKI